MPPAASRFQKCFSVVAPVRTNVRPREDIAEYLDATSGPPGRADLIFVPGTRLLEPAAIAARLLAEKVAPCVLVTGGVNKVTGTNEAAGLRRELLALGVSPDSILVEARPRTRWRTFCRAGK